MEACFCVEVITVNTCSLLSLIGLQLVLIVCAEGEGGCSSRRGTRCQWEQWGSQRYNVKFGSHAVQSGGLRPCTVSGLRGAPW